MTEFTINHSPVTLLDIDTAAGRLGISRRRANALINGRCPTCSGSGVVEIPDLATRSETRDPESGEWLSTSYESKVVECDSCSGTGRRLPAIKFGNSWVVFAAGLELPWIRVREPGQPAAVQSSAA